MATDFLISFDDLKAGSKAVKRLVQAFTRAGAAVASSDIDPKTRRSSGVNYRQVLITFTDNQKVLLGVKTTGDIFEVRVNGAALAIKNQDDQVKAVGEIAKALDAGRAKFQAKMARTKVALPKGIITAAPRMEQRLQEAETTLDAEIAAVKAKITDLRAELGEPVMDSGASAEDGALISIGMATGLRGVAVKAFAEEHKIDLVKLAAMIGRKKISPMDLMTAIAGKPGSKVQMQVLKTIGSATLDSVHTVAGETFDGGEWDTLVGMKQHGKLEDGDVPSKASRDSLVERGFVERGDGYNWLTDKGKEVAAALDAVDVPLAIDEADIFFDDAYTGEKKFNPKTDHWVTTKGGSRLLIRGETVIGGAGGKFNGTGSTSQKSTEARESRAREYRENNNSFSVSNARYAKGKKILIPYIL